MTLSRAARRFAALAAMFAITLQALWPLLSHARPEDPSLLVPVCTVDGITHYLELKPGKSPLDERTASHGEHCKLCVFGDGKGIALIAPDFAPLLLKGRAHRSTEFPRTSPYETTLLPAQPRAPPRSS